jgi:hypothetical protein
MIVVVIPFAVILEACAARRTLAATAAGIMARFFSSRGVA